MARKHNKAPYCYDAFVLLYLTSKGALFSYLLYFFFLLTNVVPMVTPPLANSRISHKARLLVSSVCEHLLDVPGFVLACFFSRASISSSIAFAIASTSVCLDILKAFQLKPIEPDKVNLTPKLIWSYVKKKYKLNTTNFLSLCNC